MKMRFLIPSSFIIMENRQTLDISWEAIGKILVVGLTLYLLFVVREIVIWFAFALVISILVEPVIVFLRKLHIPKVVAIIVVYASIFSLLGLIVWLVAPIFIVELQHLSYNIPSYFEKVNPILKSFGLTIAQNFEDFTSTLISSLQQSSENIVKAASALFGGIASTLLIFVFAFYISLEDKGPEHILSLLVPKRYEKTIASIFEHAQYQVAGWFGARVLACIFVGILSFLVFLLMGIQYAFILALVSGVLTFIPFIGPLITGILAVVFVGASQSWLMALYVIIALYVIQAVENNMFTPLLMKKFLDVPPILVLISLLIGWMVFGVLGMIFAVPVFGIVYESSREFLERRREEEHSY